MKKKFMMGIDYGKVYKRMRRRIDGGGEIEESVGKEEEDENMGKEENGRSIERGSRKIENKQKKKK